MNFSIPSSKEGISISIQYNPEIVITLPFQPVKSSKLELEQKLKQALEKVENYILSQYTMQEALPVFIRLQNVINNLNYYTHKRGLAIFVSPVLEKTIYLDFEVEESVQVDKQFKLTDITFHKKENKQYLLLLLKNNYSSLYLGHEQDLKLIKNNKLVDVKQGDATSIHDNLCVVDKSLSILLTSYKYPVFVMGDEKMVEYFKFITTNQCSIAAFDFLPSFKSSKEILLDVISKHFDNWKRINDHLLFKKIEKAKADKRLAYGTNNISKVGKSKGCLLIAEYNYPYPKRLNEGNNFFYKMSLPFNQAFYLKDTADEIAEKVLERGGSIQLTTKSTLQRYDHIVLISQ